MNETRPEPQPGDEDHTDGDLAGDSRGPARPPVFNLPKVVVWLILACAAIHVLRAYFLTWEQDIAVVVRFAFVPVRYGGDYLIDVYSFVSPVTYAFLHGNLAHLAVNMIWLAAFGSPLANRLGALRFLSFWVATSLAAVALHYLLYPLDEVPLVGASGAISGMMGAAARFAFRIDRSGDRAAFAGPILPIRTVLSHRGTLAFLVVWMAVNLVMGLGFGATESTSRIAWEAHIGGFLAGFLALRVFDRHERP